MTLRSVGPPRVLSAADRASLCEVLDRVLNKGAVVVGEITISVAD
ncbi:MAG: gas vesicle protein, partial [Acidobacteria bacterium]|nr:gas vesicle protein [Acidobacteriota bacterium]